MGQSVKINPFTGMPELGEPTYGLSVRGLTNSTMTPSTTEIVCSDLAGYGDDYFNGYFLQILLGNHELLTIDGAPAPADFAAGATLEGATSGETCEVVAKLTSTTYIVKERSGAFDDGEIISDGTNSVDCGAGYPTFAAAAAPEKQIRAVTDYVSATGTFTTGAFGQVVEPLSEVLLVHDALMAVGTNDADNVFDSTLVVKNRDGSILERTEWIIDALGGGLDFRTELSIGGPVEENAFQMFNISLFDVDAGAIASAKIDITGISATLEKSTGGADFSAVGVTQPTFAKGDGRVYCSIQFLTAEWEVGDLYRLTVSGIEAEVDGDTVYAPIAVWSNVVLEAASLDAQVAAIQTDLGDPSTRTNLKSIEAMLGNPDGAGKSLYVCLVTDRLDDATYGLAAIEGEVADLDADLVLAKTVIDDIHDTDLPAAKAAAIAIALLDFDDFDVADADANNERWDVGYINGTEGGSADINTTTAGKLRVSVDPDATPTAAAYGVNLAAVTKNKYFSAVVDVNVSSFGTPNTGWASLGMRVSPATYDGNNCVYAQRQASSDGVGNRIAVGAIFNGAAQGEVYFTTADNAVAFKIERWENVWRCYYSLAQYPDYVWVLLAQYEDPSEYMAAKQTVYLDAYSPGNDDAQTAVGDFDNFRLYENLAGRGRSIQISLEGGDTDVNRAAGKAQMKAATVDLHQAAADYDLFTGTTQDVVLSSLCFRVPNIDVSDDAGGISGITIQTDDATPQEIVSAADGAVANLTAEAQITWTGAILIKAGTKIQLSLDGGTADADPTTCDVVATYRAVVSGGYLA